MIELACPPAKSVCLHRMITRATRFLTPLCGPVAHSLNSSEYLSRQSESPGFQVEICFILAWFHLKSQARRADGHVSLGYQRLAALGADFIRRPPVVGRFVRNDGYLVRANERSVRFVESSQSERAVGLNFTRCRPARRGDKPNRTG